MSSLRQTTPHRQMRSLNGHQRQSLCQQSLALMQRHRLRKVGAWLVQRGLQSSTLHLLHPVVAHGWLLPGACYWQGSDHHGELCGTLEQVGMLKRLLGLYCQAGSHVSCLHSHHPMSHCRLCADLQASCLTLTRRLSPCLKCLWARCLSRPCVRSWRRRSWRP